MDAGTITNENGRAYAESGVLENTVGTIGTQLAKLSRNGKRLLKRHHLVRTIAIQHPK